MRLKRELSRKKKKEESVWMGWMDKAKGRARGRYGQRNGEDEPIRKVYYRYYHYGVYGVVVVGCRTVQCAVLHTLCIEF